MAGNIGARQIVCFVVTWLAYAGTYLLRKPLGVVKADLASSYNLTRTDLGWLDTALLLPYTVMQMFLASVGDKYGPRRALTACLIGSGLSMISFGFWNSLWMFGLCLFLNGSFQATAWPNCVKSLTNWFSNEQRNTIFGLFGTCSFAGGILGTALAIQLQARYSPDMRYIFLVPSVVLLVIGVTVFLTLHSPAELGLESTNTGTTSSANKERKTPSFGELWSLRMIPELCVTNCFVKLVRYCMYMWLPMYLYQQLNYTKYQAGFLSTSFEIGGVLGTATLGFLTNRYFAGQTIRAVVVALLGTTLFLGLFQYTSSLGLMVNATFMFLAGACNCGVDPYLAGSIPASIGERVDAQAAVSGLVNGFGNLGTIVEGPVIGWIAESYGWTAPFYLMVFLSLCGFLSMTKAARMEASLQKEQFMSSVASGGVDV